MNKQAEAGDLAEREIVSTRVLAAPREAVFGAFSDPAQLARWWGPKGFSNTIEVFDLKPGGQWRLSMRGPDGAEYHQEKEFIEVVKPERISFLHLESPHQFQMTMVFADQIGKTELTWRMVFESAAEYEKVKKFIEQANEENFDRLEAHLAKRA